MGLSTLMLMGQHLSQVHDEARQMQEAAWAEARRSLRTTSTIEEPARESRQVRRARERREGGRNV